MKDRNEIINELFDQKDKYGVCYNNYHNVFYLPCDDDIIDANDTYVKVLKTQHDEIEEGKEYSLGELLKDLLILDSNGFKRYIMRDYNGIEIQLENVKNGDLILKGKLNKSKRQLEMW